MKKQSLIIALLAASGLLGGSAFADGGTVNFIGTIIDSPCSIAPESQNKFVPMGNVSRAILDGGVGKGADPAKFTLLLQNCGASAKGATVTFTGTTDATVTDNLRIGVGEAVGDAATGVAIELGDSFGTKIPVGSKSANYPLAPGDNPLKFQARYVSTIDKVTVGTGNATAQFVITYSL